MLKKTKIKIVIVILFFTVIGAISIAMFNKPHVNIAKSKPDITCSAALLLNDYESNETKANALYLEKIIEVKGIISELSVKHGKGIITLENENSIGAIICHLSIEETKKIEHLKKGTSVIIKGICTGYLIDVILIKSIIK